MATISVVGLGAMGAGMARALLRAGHRVDGFDIDPARVAAFAAEGGQGGSVAEAAAASDVLVLVVLNAEQSRAVLADGWRDALRDGAVVVSCATMAPEESRDLAAQVAGAGLAFLDVPISGGPAKAEAGQLSIMAAGGLARGGGAGRGAVGLVRGGHARADRRPCH